MRLLKLFVDQHIHFWREFCHWETCGSWGIIPNGFSSIPVCQQQHSLQLRLDDGDLRLCHSAWRHSSATGQTLGICVWRAPACVFAPLVCVAILENYFKKLKNKNLPIPSNSFDSKLDSRVAWMQRLWIFSPNSEHKSRANATPESRWAAEEKP